MEFAIIMSIIFLVIFSFILIAVIRTAIDRSQMTDKLDILIDEIRQLRREIKENKHIIDKKI